MITKQYIKELEDKQNKIVERYKQLDSSIDKNKVKEYEKLKMERNTIGGRVCFNDYQAKIKQQDYEEILGQLEEFNKLNPGFEQEYNNWHNLSDNIRLTKYRYSHIRIIEYTKHSFNEFIEEIEECITSPIYMVTVVRCSWSKVICIKEFLILR